MLEGACNYCIQFTQRNLVKLLIIANSLKYKIRPTLEHQLLVQPKGAMISFGIIRQTWAQDTFKFPSSRPSSYFLYSRQKPSTFQPKKYKLKQESLVSRKFKQKFYVSIKLKQAKQESSDSSIEQKNPKYFEF